MKVEAQAYPLAWPAGWPRSRSRNSNHPFKVKSAGAFGQTSIPFDKARRSLSDELARLGANSAVMSSNIPLRADGMPYADAARRRMDDPGVAIYFMLKGKAMVMAQDVYWDVAANFRSLTLAIEAMRQLERHGGGTMMERAFTGFSALPPPEGSKPRRPWWEVLRYPVDPAEREFVSVAEVEARYRSLAKKAHPDQGGSDDAMAELSAAKEEAITELGAPL